MLLMVALHVLIRSWKLPGHSSHQRSVQAAAVKSDGSLIFSGSRDGRIIAWRESGKAREPAVRAFVGQPSVGAVSSAPEWPAATLTQLENICSTCRGAQMPELAGRPACNLF